MRKWLTFDLDGTLMQNPFMDWVFPEIVETINAHLHAKTDIMQLILKKHNERIRYNRTMEAYDWDDIVNEIVVELNLPITINVQKLVQKHAIAPKVYPLEEHIVENLRQLVQKGYSLAVVTNGYYKYQFRVMKALGLECVFEEIITPEKVGFAKPHPNILNSLAGNGEIIGHVGDRIDHDMVMANQSGVRSIFINRNLPNYLKKIPIEDRSQHRKILQFYKEKWVKEHHGKKIPFHENCIPNIVVYSINELVDYL